MKARIANVVMSLAEYYDKVLSGTQLEMYVEDLMVLTADELRFAVSKYRSNPENHFFPLPCKLIGIIRPQMSGLDEANEISNSIISAISKDGHTNTERAKQRIGSLGWEVVQRMGGWKHLCEVLDNDNEGMFRAQIRGFAETVSKKAKRGELDLKPELPSSNAATNLIAETMKRLGGE